MPIGKGILKIDDYRRLGRLIDDLEALGAYLFTYSPKRNALFVWVRGRDLETSTEYLRKNGREYKVMLGNNGNFAMIYIPLG